MREWLRSSLEVVAPGLIAAYIFGSALDPERAPNDIDLVLISKGEAGSTSWRRIIVFRDDLIERFRGAFGVPLSAMVVTPSEWSEIDGVVVRERLALL